MSDHLPSNEPFVFPEQCNQVFLVPDPIHPHWQLVVDTEVRRTRTTPPRAVEEVTVCTPATSHSEDEEGVEGPIVESDSGGRPRFPIHPAPLMTVCTLTRF
jgi:hypothetical protein